MAARAAAGHAVPFTSTFPWVGQRASTLIDLLLAVSYQLSF